MSNWTEDLFKRIATELGVTTKISAACKSVLLHNIPVKDAAKMQLVMEVNLERSLKRFNDKYMELANGPAPVSPSSNIEQAPKKVKSASRQNPVYKDAMSHWSEDEFNRVANSTNLSDRNIAACKSVIMDGLSSSEAAALHGMLLPQVSRNLKQLFNRQKELLEAMKLMPSSKEAMRNYAIKEASNIQPGRYSAEDAVPGEIYEGPAVMQTPGFFVQLANKKFIVHDLGALNQQPNLRAYLKIDYSKGGLAEVSELNPEKVKGAQKESKTRGVER
jgi:hypothetical protein